MGISVLCIRGIQKIDQNHLDARKVGGLTIRCGDRNFLDHTYELNDSKDVNDIKSPNENDLMRWAHVYRSQAALLSEKRRAGREIGSQSHRSRIRPSESTAAISHKDVESPVVPHNVFKFR
jgi:hypothetical protein